MVPLCRSLRVLACLTVLSGVIAVPQISRATTFLWNVASPGANNWNVNANWTPNTGNPGASDNAVFNATGTGPDATTINNIVSVNTTITALTYTNFGTGNWHVTQIPSGVTLIVNSNMVVGGVSNFVSSGFADSAFASQVAMTDAGTLVLHGNLNVGVSGTSAVSQNSILDLSGLSNFVYSNLTGTITLGFGSRSAANFKLANTSNNIVAGTMNLNSGSTSSGASGTTTLGAGTNIINVNTLNVGGQRANGTVTFGATGGLRLRGTNGTDADRATVTLGFRQASGSGGTTTGTLSLNGHPVDMKIGTLTMGWATNVTANIGTGVLSFDTGVVDATNIVMATTRVAGSTANGTITVGANGQLVIGSGGLSLVNLVLGTAATGNLNISGGTVTSSGNIFKSTTAGTGNITVSANGLLDMGSHTIGAVGNAIDTLDLTDSRLTLPAISGTPSVMVTNLTVNGTLDTINISSVPGLGQFPLISYTNLTGSLDFALGTLPGNYQGYISNNSVNFSVDLVITNTTTKTDVWRGNVNNNWDTTTLNWVSGGSTAFQPGDIAVFNDSLAGNSSVNLNTVLSPGGLVITNSLTNYVFSGTGKLSGTTSLVKQYPGTLTLTETGGDDFSGGVTVSDGTLIFDSANSAISGGLAINSGTVQVGNNDANGSLPAGPVTDNGALVFKRTDAVTVNTAISGGGTLVQAGSGTLTLGSAQTYSGATAVTSGTLALNSSGSISSGTAVGVQNATLDLSARVQTGLNDLNVTNSTLVLWVSNSPSISCANLTGAGVTNHVNIQSLPPIASYPITFKIIQSANAIGGTFNFGLGTLPAATPSYVATITESVDQTAVLLNVTAGPIGARPFVSWSGADVPNLNTNWSDGQNWLLPGAPVSTDNVVFNGTATQASSALSTLGGGMSALIPDNINNYVDTSFIISALTYTNFGSTYHNTYLKAGSVLSITNGNLNIGALDTGSTAQQGFVTISGTNNATLNISNTNNNLQVWLGNASNSTTNNQATLDLSALETFKTTVGRVLIGATINNAVNRPSGILYLARTNSINAAFQTTSIDAGTTTGNAAIDIGDCNGNAGAMSSVFLGMVNNISADTIAIGRQKASGHLQFNPIYANVAPYPTVTFQGSTSGTVSIFEIGNGVGNTGGTTLNADANLTGGFVNGSIDLLILGRASSGAGTGTTAGTLSLDAGTLAVNNLVVGLQPAGGTKIGIGTNNVSTNTVMGTAATLSVSGSLTLGSAASSSGATGVLNITNATVRANAIVAGTNATSIINLVGGRLIVTNTIGSSSAPLGTLNLTPLNTADNSNTVLQVPASATASVVVDALNIDGLDTTTNLINISSIGAITPPVELPVIQYNNLNMVGGGTFNLGLGTLPSGFTGYLTNDTTIKSIAVIITAVTPSTPPSIKKITISGGNVTISGTNNVGGASGTYHVLASTNITVPRTNWSVLTNGSFDANGNFSSTIPVDTTKPRSFYILQIP